MPQTTIEPRRVITINLDRLTRRASVAIAMVALLIAVVSLGMWWKYVYTTPRHVFAGMLANNLSTTSVTRVVNSSQEGETVSQSTQISFVGEPKSHNTVILKQKDASGKDSQVKTETIGTRTADYSRYLSITSSKKNASGKALDYSKVEGQWGKTGTNDATAQPPQYLQQAVLGLVPFANMSPQDRQKILQQIDKLKVYDVDYAHVKGEKVNGQVAWTYPVKLAIGSYVTVLQTVTKTMRIDSASLDPATYASAPPVELNISVGKTSHQLVQVSYKDGSQQEQYTGYGLKQHVEVPQKAIPLSDLQQQVQAIQ